MTDHKEPENGVTDVAEPSRAVLVMREILSGSALMSVLAVLFALLIGGVLIAVTDARVQEAVGYFTSRPADTLFAIWESVSGAYIALFQGSIYNFRRPGFENGIRPLLDTLTFATPLIVAGLGVALGFRAGLFNIGGRGQMLFGAAAAGWVAFSFPLPFGIHLFLALVAGVAAGALWGGIAGFLKARTGAHEVITTIMLNYVAYYFVYWMLSTPGLLQAPGSNNPKTPAMLETAVLPPLFGPKYTIHWGLIIAIGATFFVWWLLNRSSLGFQFKAVGFNPNAARVAGINVNRMFTYVMLFSGALVGLAGVFQVLGTVKTGFSAGIDAGVGFDAITVALLGRSKPWGVFAAGLLFGAFKAGGFAMQASEGIPIDIVLVVQSMIVLLIAAPPLVRAIFRLPAPSLLGTARSVKLEGKKAVVSK
ncbi:MAG: ABC transporter permease [Microbacteriaceae bacterium]|nr:ABC transporter permease [Microbacteriaceae bacterium]